LLLLLLLHLVMVLLLVVLHLSEEQPRAICVLARLLQVPFVFVSVVSGISDGLLRALL
jgi:hypothetical protein